MSNKNNYQKLIKLIKQKHKVELLIEKSNYLVVDENNKNYYLKFYQIQKEIEKLEEVI